MRGIGRKKKRFKAKQTVVLLRNAEKDGATVVEECRAHGISEAIYSRWKRRYGGMGVTEGRRLRQLEDENERLKKLGAERIRALAAARVAWRLVRAGMGFLLL